jgi:hypothetical protein
MHVRSECAIGEYSRTVREDGGTMLVGYREK